MDLLSISVMALASAMRRCKVWHLVLEGDEDEVKAVLGAPTRESANASVSFVIASLLEDFVAVDDCHRKDPDASEAKAEEDGSGTKAGRD